MERRRKRQRSGKGLTKVNTQPTTKRSRNSEHASREDSIQSVDSMALSPCSPPDTRITPHFMVPHRQAMPILPLAVEKDLRLSICCVGVRSFELILGLDLQYEQTWDLIKLAIGDLSSTIGFAPSEQLTLEFQSSLRKVLEQSTLDSVEELSSTESTEIDKEVLNVSRSSSKSKNWHVDGSGSIEIGPAKLATLGVSGGISESITQNAQTSSEQVNEATDKSAHNLKTLHKIEVRGVTESLVQNRMTRIIKNPYPDRTLSLNIFQLLKQFSVETKLVALRPAIYIRAILLDFSDDFISSNTDFLKQTLLDQSFVDDLPLALQSLQPVPQIPSKDAIEAAKLALQYLFDVPNVFNVQLFLLPHTQDPHAPQLPDPNLPSSSFDGTVAFDGLDDALTENFGDIFTTLNLFYKVYREKMHNHSIDKFAVNMAKAINDSAGSTWSKKFDGTDPSWLGHIKNILDQNNYTEIFRRLSGFTAMVSGLLTPLLPAAADQTNSSQERDQAVFALLRLKKHLACNSHYYTQQYLKYIAEKTKNQAIRDFVQRLVESAIASNGLFKIFPPLFDVDAAFISLQQIVVPYVTSFNEKQVTSLCKILEPLIKSPSSQNPFSYEDLEPNIVEVEVPCDGVHLEVSEGACILKNIPSAQGKSVDFTIKDLDLKVESGQGQ